MVDQNFVRFVRRWVHASANECFVFDGKEFCSRVQEVEESVERRCCDGALADLELREGVVMHVVDAHLV